MKHKSILIKLSKIAVLLLSPFFSYIFIEYLVLGESVLSFNLYAASLNLMLYATIYFVFYFLTKSVYLGSGIGSVLFTTYGLINAYIIRFKGQPLVPFDILAIRTAANVAGEYSYKLDPTMIEVLYYNFLWIIMLIMLHKASKKHNVRLFEKNRFFYGMMALGFMFLSINIIDDEATLAKNGVEINFWSQIDGYMENGTLLSFANNFNFLIAEKPVDYDYEEIDELLTSIESNQVMYESTVKATNIIAIMNESYTDFSVVGELNTTDDYLSYYHSLSDSSLQGSVVVPVSGGGTANSEFEFLTGNTMALLPKGSYPYQTYIKDDSFSIVQLLNNQNYYTSVLHSFWSSGWNRVSTYSKMGFDETIFLEDMSYEEEDLYRMYPSDKFTYSKVIEQYEKNKDENQFIFCITMQNHGGYSEGIDTTVEVVDADGFGQVNEFLTTMSDADKQLEILINYFNEIEEPTVIMMFGDHHPGFDVSIYDYILGEESERSNEDIINMYSTPYFIWANYELQPSEVTEISLNYLSTYLLQVAGVELGGYNRFLNDLYFKYPVISTSILRNSYGDTFLVEDSLESTYLNIYNKIQYNNLFDKNHISNLLY